MRRYKVLSILLVLSFLINFSVAKDKKVKTNDKQRYEEVLVPIEKKVNEKEFSKQNTKKKQKKEVEVEIK